MKTILVPTDFSANADNALQYAIELNKKLKAEIILFHSVFVPLYATDVPVAIPSDEDLKREATKTLTKIKDRVSRQNPGMAFSIKTTAGFTEDEIIEEEKAGKVQFVVMGTLGASGLREFFIGSNTATVIDKSICPVIAVPEKAALNTPKKIVFATNYGEDDFANTYSIIDFARPLEAEIYLLHITEGKLDKTYEFAEIENFTERFRSVSRYPKISFKLLEAADVYEGLNNYLEEIRADMVAVSMRERRFKFFSRSLTKKMAYHSHIPLMAFHTNI